MKRKQMMLPGLELCESRGKENHPMSRLEKLEKEVSRLQLEVELLKIQLEKGGK